MSHDKIPYFYGLKWVAVDDFDNHFYIGEYDNIVDAVHKAAELMEHEIVEVRLCEPDEEAFLRRACMRIIK